MVNAIWNDGVLFLWYVKQTRKTDLDRVVDTDQKEFPGIFPVIFPLICAGKQDEFQTRITLNRKKERKTKDGPRAVSNYYKKPALIL